MQKFKEGVKVWTGLSGYFGAQQKCDCSGSSIHSVHNVLKLHQSYTLRSTQRINSPKSKWVWSSSSVHGAYTWIFFASHGKDKGRWLQVNPGEISIGHKREIFHNESSHWNILSRELDDSATPDTLKIQPYRVLGHLA